jgi:UDP-N-acetylmuramoylalanine--D-glutamate ligase
VSGTRPEPAGPSGSWLPQRALVIGIARSGQAAALALARRGVVTIAADRSRDADPGRLAAAGVEVHLGTEEESLLEGVELVVKSPGVPGESPLAAAAHLRGIPLWSEVELGYRLLPAGARLIGVTGTNGKTTTTELLGTILRADDRPTEVAGNVGRPLTDAAEQAGLDSWIVCELSSFQLEDVDSLACDVAVLLNLEPDHLDRHGSFEAYRDAKLRIFERARAAVVPSDFGLPGIEFSADDELPAEPLIPGRHNRENAAAATAAARAAGVPDEAIAEALRTFPGVPHRLELVRELHGVRWVNDSKATNVAAAIRAIETYADDIVHLIVGGSSKGEDFTRLASAIGPRVRPVHSIGEEAKRILEVLDGHVDGTLDRAVQHAAALARPGEVVLLSPACASYDQFANFEERGDTFRRLVEGLE